MQTNLSIIIPFFNGYETLDRLILSLPRKLPIIIADDLSDKLLTQEYIDNTYSPEDGNNIRVVRLSRKGYFSGAVNRGIQECETDVLVLNQDTWFDSLSAFSLLESHKNVFGMIGEKIVGDHPSFGDLGYIHGTFMWIRRDVIEKVGLLNEKDYPLWGNSALYQWQVARAGFEVLPLKEIPGFHHKRKETESFGSGIKTLLEREPERQSILIRTPPLLSVVVLCYNYASYLHDCINSLLGGPTSLGELKPQTLQSFEIVIVDDASTDTTPEVAQSIAKIEKGIRYYRLEKNVGTAQALNYGISRCYGKYITFLSADDMREYDSLEKLVSVCEQNPHSFAYDDVWLVYKNQRVKKWPMEEYDFDKLIYQNQVHAGIVFPRTAWLEVGGYPKIMNDGREDWAFNIALGLHGYCGVHVNNYGYLYRREGQNRTERNTSAYFKEYFLDKIKSVFPRIYGGYRPMACCGKGSGPKAASNARVSSLGVSSMAETIGTQGMVKLEYLGKQVASTWQGEVTGATYTFGVDRKRGWVDKRDVGTREDKKGFLNKKDRNTNQWLFQEVEKVAEKVVEKTEEQIPEIEIVTVVKGSSAESSEFNLSGTLTARNKSSAPDPTDANVEQVKKWELSKDEWQEVYRIELANRNRKGLVSFLEDLIANWKD